MRYLGNPIGSTLIAAPFGVRAGRSFVPTELADLSLWLRGRSLAASLSDLDAVTQWDDESGNSKHYSQSNAAKKPQYEAAGLNGQPCVRFDGVDDYLARAYFGGGPEFSCLVVLEPESGGEWPYYPYTIDNSGDRLLNIRVDNLTAQTISVFYQPASTVNVFGVASAGCRLIRVVRKTAEAELWVNGVLITSVSTPGTPTVVDTNTAIGQIGYGFGFMKGRIGEILFYNRVLSESEMDAVELYLMSKYGLT